MDLPIVKTRQDAYLNYLAGEGALDDLPKPCTDFEHRLYAICVHRDDSKKAEGVASISLTVKDGAVTSGTWKDSGGKSHKISVTVKSST